ncbi:MAG: hypothetical protein KF729_33435 [Sandaracinaceae bacterium]|nr:hypothetical protein [Sandaracinaceae bacterium]
MRGRAAILALTLTALGCAQNAYFELQVQLPAAPAGQTWYAQVQVRDSTNPLSIPWMGPGDVPSIPLEASPRWDCISIEGTRPDVTLHVRVRFCRSPDCLDLEDGDPPQRLYSFETPFYIGSRTYYRVQVPRIPVCTTDADCASGACIEERCGCATSADCGPTERCEPGAGCVTVVTRCQIEGCIEGPVSASYCSGETEQHFCERNPSITRDETFMCSR